MRYIELVEIDGSPIVDTHTDSVAWGHWVLTTAGCHCLTDSWCCWTGPVGMVLLWRSHRPDHVPLRRVQDALAAADIVTYIHPAFSGTVDRFLSRDGHRQIRVNGCFGDFSPPLTVSKKLAYYMVTPWPGETRDWRKR